MDRLRLRRDEKEIYEALMSAKDEDVDEWFDEYEIKLDLTHGQRYGTAKYRGMKHVKVMAMIAANRELPLLQQEMLKHLAKPEPENYSKHKCADCGVEIRIEPPELDPVDPVLCQKCDPNYASLLDNKYHKGFVEANIYMHPEKIIDKGNKEDK